MSKLDISEQLVALEKVRAELEAALGSDENWRALRRSGTKGPGGADPDRRDRDARLTKAMEANPLYGAWTQLSMAIACLREAAKPSLTSTLSSLDSSMRSRFSPVTPGWRLALS